MIAEAGHFALTLALLVALVQASVPMIGAHRGDQAWMELARPAALAQFLLIAFAFACLTYAFSTRSRACGGTTRARCFSGC